MAVPGRNLRLRYCDRIADEQNFRSLTQTENAEFTSGIISLVQSVNYTRLFYRLSSKFIDILESIAVVAYTSSARRPAPLSSRYIRIVSTQRTTQEYETSRYVSMHGSVSCYQQGLLLATPFGDNSEQYTPLKHVAPTQEISDPTPTTRTHAYKHYHLSLTKHSLLRLNHCS